MPQPPHAASQRMASQWLADLEGPAGHGLRALSALYGGDAAVAVCKMRHVAALLNAYLDRHGDGPVILSRAPGRVNLMGRHVDHQGGRCNMIALDRDIWIAAGLRDDREVRASNLACAAFPDRCFHLDEIPRERPARSWHGFVDSAAVRDAVVRAQGDWSQYVKAPLARLMARHDCDLRGLNIVVGGDLPMAAGLSSSSAIVVATMEAVLALNGLEHTDSELVELCGEAEWFVGTRGGSGDHAAMKMAQPGEVVQLDFQPLARAGSVPFPSGCVLLICDSHEKARKTEGARAAFNHRVACYHLGRELLRREFPEHADAIVHLRDVNSRTLGITPTDVLQMVGRLPVGIRGSDLRPKVPAEVADRWLPHGDDQSDAATVFPLRSVVLFGLAECERSRRCAELLRDDRVNEFGRLMNVSHDGDRVSRWDGRNSRPFAADYSDAALGSLIERAEPGRAAPDLAMQPGAYACSTRGIDRMVDVALSVEGVVGAQLSGAGLGGCMMALVRRESCERLERAMTEGYYAPLGLEPAAFACRPVAGSGILTL